MTITKNEGGITITPESYPIWDALRAKTALKMFMVGMRPNRHWTPTKVLAWTSELTGVKLRRGQYQMAILALDDWLKKQGQ